MPGLGKFDSSKREFLKGAVRTAAAVTAIGAGLARTNVAEARGLSPQQENIFTNHEQGEQKLRELFGKHNVGIATINYKAGLEDRKFHQRRALVVNIEAALKQNEGFGGKIVVFGYKSVTGEDPANPASRYIVRQEIELTPDKLGQAFVQNYDGDATVLHSSGNEGLLPNGCLFFPITNTVHTALKDKQQADTLDNNAGWTVANVYELNPDYDGYAVFVVDDPESGNKLKMTPDGLVVTEWQEHIKDIAGVLIDKQGNSLDIGSSSEEAIRKYNAFIAQTITTMERDGL